MAPGMYDPKIEVVKSASEYNSWEGKINDIHSRSIKNHFRTRVHVAMNVGGNDTAKHFIR